MCQWQAPIAWWAVSIAQLGRLGWVFGEGKRALPKVGTKLRLGCSVKIENEPLGKHDFPHFRRKQVYLTDEGNPLSRCSLGDRTRDK